MTEVFPPSPPVGFGATGLGSFFGKDWPPGAFPKRSENMTTNGQLPPPLSSSSDSYEENGRLYHSYRKGIYMYPCDEKEKERLDMAHQLFITARNDKLHTAPVRDDESTRILDLGTGTGIWAIDMADKFQRAEVIGIDLANIQPESIPRNLRFRVPRDYESPSWGMGENSFDLIHLRCAVGSVSNWAELYQKIFLHLKPGAGWIEHVEIDFQPRCDDGTMDFRPIVQWYENLKDATERSSRPITYLGNTRSILEAAGFIDIQEQIIRAPFNAWPKDPHQKMIGRWYSACLSEAIEALSLAPFCRNYNWTPQDVHRFSDEVKAFIMNRHVHGYNNIHIWTGRRPTQ